MGSSYRDTYQSGSNRLDSSSATSHSFSSTYSRAPRSHSVRPLTVDGSNLHASTDLSPYITTRTVRTNEVAKNDHIPTSELSRLSVRGDEYSPSSLTSSTLRSRETYLPPLKHMITYDRPSLSPERVSDSVYKSPSSGTSSNNSSAPRLSSSTTLPKSSISAGSTGIVRSNSGDKRNGGLAGLSNLGNTCFMNSILQALSNTEPLLDFCLSNAYVDDLNKSSSMRGMLIQSYASLMKDLWNPEAFETAVNPHQFKMQIQRYAPRFVGYSQQDAQEFLRYLLEGLHTDVNRVIKRPPPVNPDYTAEDKMPDRDKADLYWKRYLSMDNSEIVNIFVGQLMSTLECAECGFKSTTFDPFWDLSLPIPKKPHVNIMDCLRLFTSEEDLDGHERPICGRCKVRRRCLKSLSIQKFPRVLVLHLKRFSGERFRSKMSAFIDFPTNGLDLSEFASPCSYQRVARYNLYAVSNHSGSVYAGHYTAYCMHHQQGRWFEYNDSRVRPINSQSIVSSEGYVLFYELTG